MTASRADDAGSSVLENCESGFDGKQAGLERRRWAAVSGWEDLRFL
ncbi:hypothetical protein PALA52_02659 [Pseudomonas aeruginosa]|nr:hypothetical protein PALA52_02659 [Pseudomonas aeruginosa]